MKFCRSQFSPSLYPSAKTRVTNGEVLLSQKEPEEPAADTTEEPKEAEPLEMYAFSNGIALSVKLAIWEAILEKYSESIETWLHVSD